MRSQRCPPRLQLQGGLSSGYAIAAWVPGWSGSEKNQSYQGPERLIHVQIFCLGERGEPRRCRAAGRDRSSASTVGQPGGNPAAIKGKLCISIRNLQAAGKFTLVQLLAQSCK